MGTVDDYLAGLEPADRDAVEPIYAIAREVVPDAEQGKGYGMPALTYRGKPLLSVMRTKKHIGIYPFSADAVAAAAPRLAASTRRRARSDSSRRLPHPPTPSASWSRLGATRSEPIRTVRRQRNTSIRATHASTMPTAMAATEPAATQ